MSPLQWLEFALPPPWILLGSVDHVLCLSLVLMSRVGSKSYYTAPCWSSQRIVETRGNEEQMCIEKSPEYNWRLEARGRYQTHEQAVEVSYRARTNEHTPTLPP